MSDSRRPYTPDAAERHLTLQLLALAGLGLLVMLSVSLVGVAGLLEAP